MKKERILCLDTILSDDDKLNYLIQGIEDNGKVMSDKILSNIVKFYFAIDVFIVYIVFVSEYFIRGVD